MTLFYKNVIVGVFWALILFLVLQSNTSQMFLTMLFTIFVLHFSEDNLQGRVKKDSIRKGVSLLVAFGAIGIFGYLLYQASATIWTDLNGLLASSQDEILALSSSLGLDVSDYSELHAMAVEFMKSNMEFLTFSAGLLVKVFLGVILGIIVHMSPIKPQNNHAWDEIMATIVHQSKTMYRGFRNIMQIQAKIAVMNTIIISIMAIPINWIIFGEMLPYWYAIIPLAAILSLLPVIGNVLINLILVAATVQMAPWYVLVSVLLFGIMHKVEMAVVGAEMNKKLNVPFSAIIFSMVLGEFLFHSMSGMVLGMVLMVTMYYLLRELKGPSEYGQTIETVPTPENMEDNSGK